MKIAWSWVLGILSISPNISAQPTPEPAPEPLFVPPPVTEPGPAPEAVLVPPEPAPVPEPVLVDPVLADAWQRVEPQTIGVLLPLSGPHEKLGRAAQDALALALAEVAPNVRVVVRDTGGEPGRAAAEAEALIRTERVAALFGPIGRQESAASAAVARRFAVPQVVLASVVPGVTDPTATETVFRIRLSPGELARALARHAAEAVGIRRAVIIRPRNESGTEAAAAFTAELVRLGGVVVKEIDYAAGALDADEVMRTLTGAKRPTKKMTFDFDAVFVPDQGAVGLRLASQLAAWGVPLKKSPGPAAGRVQLLGLTGWASSLTIDRMTGLTENAIFVEPWAPSADAGAAFERRFRARYEKAPTPFHAEVYRAASFLAGPVREAGGADQAVRVAITTRLVSERPTMAAPQILTVDGTTIRTRLAESDELVKRTTVAAPTPDP